MKRSIQICSAIVVAGVLESVRRRDFLVVLILTVLLIVGAYSFTFFGVSGLEMFVKDMAFTSVALFSTILGVIISARQVPEEIQRKTIYPILARPINRWQFLVGKMAVAWINSVIVFLALSAVATCALALMHIYLTPIYLQYLLLKCLSFLWLCGFTIFLSTVFSQGAAVTLGLILSLGSSAFDRTFVMVSGPTSRAMTPILQILYGLLPHYALFDLSQKVVYEWEPISWSVVLLLALYALVIGPFWLWLGWLRFRRQAV